MRNLVLGFLFLTAVLAGALPALAQHRGYGYVFGAPGGSTPGGEANFHIGAGGEGLIYKGLGAGADIGYLTPVRDWGSGVGLLSVNGSYHFLPQDRRLDPFVTAGYSLVFRSGSANLVNFGGGVQYWMRDRLGLRAEFRDHVLPNPAVHYLEVRFGLCFR
jgi:hypothetical protein